LLGLTATPFRGWSEAETDALVKRFGVRRIDAAVFGDDDPYTVLQARGVLAQVEMRRLTGSKLALSAREIDQVKQLHRLPSAAEDRLGKDVDRNRTLLDDILSLPGDWPVLLFATSVAHAQVMAALLTQAGVPAASISSTTEPGARRHYVDAFRDGSLRVLTNYGVLTQGFDAPKVRAVYVGRPTYSPNMYQQMIGRGLRGPLNGGEEECLIVNVEDNIVNYGEQLAFTEFEYLWNRRQPA
jgi:superfamily II DNA or RNA helicase